MLLTIDAGNTRTKWAVFNQSGEITHDGACQNSALAAADLSPDSLGYERAIISNVAGDAHAQLLSSKLSACKLPAQWITSSQQAANVFNTYTEPATLGTDRWAALIAAWDIQQGPCVVVNAGTAVTIDALMYRDPNALPHHAEHSAQGEFAGGLILPGLGLMQSSLGQATAQLPKNDSVNNAAQNKIVDIFAKSTSQAICAGALNAISGAIDHMAAAVETKCSQKALVILSGGNASSIKGSLSKAVANHAIIVDNLVLQGLYLLDHSN